MNMKTKQTWLLPAILSLIAAAATAPLKAAGDRHKAHGHGAHAEQGRAATVSGEIIDLSCYMAHEGKGKKHQKCAKACVLDKGLPMGILTKDGKVLILVEDHKAPKAYKQAKELAAAQVEIKGLEFVRGGTKAIAVKSVEKK